MKTKPLSLYVVYVWLFVFGLIPLSLILFTSFLSRDPQHLVALPFTLTHYQTLFTPDFLRIFFRSFLMGFLATAFCLLLAYPFSYLLVKSKHQSLLLVLIIIPFWTSSLIRTYALIAILKFQGLLNIILQSLHLISKPLSLLYTNGAVMAGLVYTLFPFMVLPLFSNMQRFDFRLIEAAKDLGANAGSIFFRVFLPSTMGGIISGCVLVFLPAMTLFYIPNVLGGARSILLGNLIQNQFLVAENWPQGSATSTLLTAVFLLLYFLYRKPSQER